ncbi:unnamed protein product [Candidula unifasciata]|uniref:Ferritin n=1 Tax=Candidula unifasciata TaxID=100452 RepID=A0A8S3YIV0_9EUPU|nr:unnamed protein product [Candidula unifasciata]
MGNLICPKLLCGFFVFLALVCLTKQQDEGFVSNVFQFFSDKVNNRLMEHITMRHNVELAYKAYVAYFDRADVDLPGFKKLFQQLEKDAHDRALSLTSYINSRGGRVRFPVVKLSEACKYIHQYTDKRKSEEKTQPCICYFQFQDSTNKVNIDDYCEENWRLQSGLQGVKEALALERSVNNDLIILVGLAISQNDPHSKITIEHVMDQQIETIKKLADLLDKLQGYQQDQEGYSLGEYLVDNEIKK